MGSYHSLVGVVGAVGDVQQFGVLELLTDALQEVERLVESGGHGDAGQVLPDVVVEDGEDADVAVIGAGRGQNRAPSRLLRHAGGKVRGARHARSVLHTHYCCTTTHRAERRRGKNIRVDS